MRPKHIIDTLTEGDMGKVESPHPGRRGAMSVERLRLRWPMANRKVEGEEKMEEKMEEEMEEKMREKMGEEMGENAEAEVRWKLRKVGEKEKMVFREEEEEVALEENIRNKK